MRDELRLSRELDLDPFVARWQKSAASERSNYQLFLIGLCDVLGVERPKPATGEQDRDEYIFERPVHFQNADESISTGFIDLYRHAFAATGSPRFYKRWSRSDRRAKPGAGLTPPGASTRP